MLLLFAAKISHKLIEVGILKKFECSLLRITMYSTENNCRLYRRGKVSSDDRPNGGGIPLFHAEDEV
jgi:hypothetical protein